MPISDFTNLMSDTVQHAEFAGRNAYGLPAYGSAIEYTARVVQKATWIRRADGSEVLAKTVVWIAGTPTITPEDQITLPDSTTPPILNTEKLTDADGAHHVKVYFG